MYYYFFIMTALLSAGWTAARADRKYRNVLIVFSGISCLVYIVWRAAAVPLKSGAVNAAAGVILYAAELMGSAAFFNFQYLFMGKSRFVKKTLKDYGDKEVPFADVLICTYNELLYLLEMTIAAAANMEYPSGRFKVHVCDDGRREELKKLCGRYGVGYISREDNRGAKAGNINNALKYITGDLFAVLDADMIPKKEFLKETAGYFSSPKVAFVQTPQVYYNQDMYQYNLSLRIPNEQDFFMRDIQEARASRNATLHVGTNAVFRRKAVMEIGGYPSYSITEDMAVGMALQAGGYDSVFVNEELVYGLSAITFSELVKQRDRWCRGNLQVIRHNNILKQKGFTAGQKIAYLDGGLYWLSNLQKMVFILFPILHMLTGITAISCRWRTLAAVFLPHIMGELMVFSLLAPRTRRAKWAHYYETVMAPYLSLSIIKELLNLRISFNVTSKENVIREKEFQGLMVLPHMVLIALTAAGWGVSAFRLAAGALHPEAFALNFLWSLFNMLGLFTAVRVAWQKPIFRKTERVQIKDPMPCSVRYQGKSYPARLRDLSGRGAGLSLEKEVRMGPGRRVRLDIGTERIRCRIVRSGEKELGVEFGSVTPENMKFIMSLFCENLEPYYKYYENGAFSPASLSLFCRPEM